MRRWLTGSRVAPSSCARTGSCWCATVTTAARFWSHPGGGALAAESVADTAVRETFEETGVRVSPGHVLLVEDILTPQFKMCKIWMACTVEGGAARSTDGARLEGIVECRWFRRAELDSEMVYPWIITARPWSSFYAAHYDTEVSPTRRAVF
jgi:8-oxo-dGTP pyrophosphatase MutT (NUDIX family)